MDSTASTDLTATSTGIGINEPAGRTVIFQIIVPDNEKRRVNRRAISGFIGDENPDVCTFATTFNLAEGQLFDGGVPIFYSGEDFKELSGQDSPSSGAITTNFETSGQQLLFKNSGLPNGEASFCQNSNGVIYIVFTAGPSSCVPVNLAVYDVEQCQNGRLVGVGELTSTTRITNSETASVHTISSATESLTLTEAHTDSTTMIATSIEGVAISQSSEAIVENLRESSTTTPTESVDSESDTASPEIPTTTSSGVVNSSTSISSIVTTQPVQETSVTGVSDMSNPPDDTIIEERSSTIESMDYISSAGTSVESERLTAASSSLPISETTLAILTRTTTFATTGLTEAGTEITLPGLDERTSSDGVNIEDTTTTSLDLPTTTEGDTTVPSTTNSAETTATTIDPCLQLENPYLAGNGKRFDILCNTGYDGAAVYDSIYDLDFQGCLEGCADDNYDCEGVCYRKEDKECNLFMGTAGPQPDEGYNLAFLVKPEPEPQRL
ncbi:hypothetical protein NW768_004907 [Fusarium equiseti]|uniref:DUF7908 domain-containing protein n=1 Tax=Fusarium equiseti TaxID=61235 RepID=A0ABQ8RI82_FUSEQ|nr:hypothetical protein NW768_004907 [Fusarium equiseti]